MLKIVKDPSHFVKKSKFFALGGALLSAGIILYLLFFSKISDSLPNLVLSFFAGVFICGTWVIIAGTYELKFILKYLDFEKVNASAQEFKKDEVEKSKNSNLSVISTILLWMVVTFVTLYIIDYFKNSL